MSCIHNNYCAFPEKITRIWCKAIGRKEINKSSETSSPLLISFNSFLESVRLFCLRERYAESETLKAISGHGCLVVMHHPSCRYEVERWYLLGNSICKGQKMITGPHSPLILHWTRQHALTCSPAMKTKRLTMNVPPFSCRRILLSFPFSDEEKEIATSITGTLSAFTWLTSFLLRISSFLSPADYLYHPHNSKEFFRQCAHYIYILWIPKWETTTLYVPMAAFLNRPPNQSWGSNNAPHIYSNMNNTQFIWTGFGG